MRKICGVVIALILGLSSAQASNLYIREYRQLPIIKTAVPQVALEPGADQAVLNFASSAQSSAAFASTTNYVRLICDAACSVVFSPAGASTTAATNANALLPANLP